MATLPMSDLIETAKRVRENAYAPYSGYRVGAAILDSSGQIWSGCNVENVSYGLCVCAERTALCKMVSEGQQELIAVAVVTKDSGTPCGMCLQSLLEFTKDPTRVDVITVSEQSNQVHYKLSDLIPHGFQTGDLKRT